MTHDELIEAVAKAIWEQQCQHWGHYRDKIPDLCGWDDLTQGKQREVIREARAAIRVIAPAVLEQAANVAPAKIRAETCETVGQWERRALREAIRALKTRYEQ